MYIFIIAILVSLVIRSVSKFIIHLYVDQGKTDEELSKSFVFNAAVVSYMVNSGMILINGTILAAIAVRTYLL